jgi:hypothetical protein
MKLPDAFLSKKPLEARKGERKMLPISAVFYSLEIKGNEGRRLQIKLNKIPSCVLL